MNDKIVVEESSGNVFRDLGFPDADGLALRADLAAELFRILNQKKWTQTKAAEVLGIDQPQISRLKNGDFDHFSLERLLLFLNKLNRDVEIRITKMKTRKPRQQVIYMS